MLLGRRVCERGHLEAIVPRVTSAELRSFLSRSINLMYPIRMYVCMYACMSLLLTVSCPMPPHMVTSQLLDDHAQLSHSCPALPTLFRHTSPHPLIQNSHQYCSPLGQYFPFTHNNPTSLLIEQMSFFFFFSIPLPSFFHSFFLL